MSQNSCDDENPSQPTIKGNQQEYATSNDQQIPARQQCERAAINSSVAQLSTNEDQWHNEQKRYWKRQIRISKWLNWITIGGGIIAVGALIAVYAQLQMMKTSLHVSERAWITVKGITIANPLAEGEAATIIAGFENSGHSPALQMTVTNAVTVGDIKTLGDMPKFPDDPNRSLVAIGPNSKTTVNIRHLITREDISNLQAKKASLYSYGIINYADIFGTKHWTTFCYRSASITELNLVACSGWNDIDKN
jgi:hypothetical protein